jgi:hypothetical protein
VNVPERQVHALRSFGNLVERCVPFAANDLGGEIGEGQGAVIAETAEGVPSTSVREEPVHRIERERIGCFVRRFGVVHDLRWGRRGKRLVL